MAFPNYYHFDNVSNDYESRVVRLATWQMDTIERAMFAAGLSEAVEDRIAQKNRPRVLLSNWIDTLSYVTSLNSAADIARWLQQELSSAIPDVVIMTRVIARETDRWIQAGLRGDQAAYLVEEPATTGNQHWDALLEGVVAYRCDRLEVRRPSWTRRTFLEVGWNPYDDTSSIRLSPKWALLDTLETPSPILEKGVTYSYRNMELL